MHFPPPPTECTENLKKKKKKKKKEKKKNKNGEEGAEDGGPALTCPPWWPGCDAALNAKRLEPPLGTKQFLLFKNEKVEEK